MSDFQRIDDIEKLLLVLRDRSRMARLGSLIRGVAHNLNGTLQVLSMQAEMVQRIAHRLDEKTVSTLREKVEHCVGQIDKLREMLLILQMASPSNEATEVQKVHINEVLEKTVGLFHHHLMFKHQIEVKKNFSSRIPSLKGHAIDFEEGLSNLIENAIEAMEETSQKILTLTTRASQDHIQVVIGDTGCGVPESLRPKLFTPFFTTKDGSHYGLGLYMARRLLAPYGATIEPHFKEGETLFSVKIPLRRS
ncbi:MAG: ATP-binding protein [Desulfobacterota bacterium]|nr:ATP-binding protein [Thermodesulfobacteriota bacterium]